MFMSRNHQYNFLLSLRCAAWNLGVFCIGMFLLFLFSLALDLLYVADENPAVMLILLLGFLSGLVLAWLDEPKGGGALAILSLAAFYFAYRPALGGSFKQLVWICIFASPALLFLLYGAISSLKKRKTASIKGQQRAPSRFSYRAGWRKRPDAEPNGLWR